MKRITSISVALVFLFNTVVFFFLYPIMMDHLKERFDEEEEREECEYNRVFEVIDGQPVNFVFMDNKEIKADGSLYDILKVEKEGNKTVYYCYHDKEEENLENGLLDRSKEKSGTPRHQFRTIPLNIFLIPGVSNDNCSKQDKFIFPAFVMHNIKFSFREVITPPPNF
jgi:hypothetical protein